MTEISAEKRLAFIEFLMHLPRPLQKGFGVGECQLRFVAMFVVVAFGQRRFFADCCESCPSVQSLLHCLIPRQAKEYKSCLNDLSLGFVLGTWGRLMSLGLRRY